VKFSVFSKKIELSRRSIAVCFAQSGSLNMKLGLINEIMMALFKVFVSCSYDNQSQSYRVMKTRHAEKWWQRWSLLSTWKCSLPRLSIFPYSLKTYIGGLLCWYGSGMQLYCVYLTSLDDQIGARLLQQFKSQQEHSSWHKKQWYSPLKWTLSWWHR
jgi:hypothetical protein